MNLNKLLRSNINGMTPYSSARDEYKDLEAGSNYTFTSNNIKVGDNISTLQSIYPLSYANKNNGGLALPLEDMDLFFVISFNNSTVKGFENVKFFRPALYLQENYPYYGPSQKALF